MQTELKIGLAMVAALALTAPIWLGPEHKCPALQPHGVNGTAEAIPAFARKYNANCEMCHTIWPQLNRTGYIFRRLGYRMPYEVVAANTAPPAKAPTSSQPGAPSAPQAPAEAPKSPVSTSEGDPAHGRIVFEKGGCAACHAGGGNVVNSSKPIKGDKFLAKYPDYDTMAKLIRAGVPGTAMPGFGPEKINDSDLKDLVAYVRSLTPTQ